MFFKARIFLEWQQNVNKSKMKILQNFMAFSEYMNF